MSYKIIILCIGLIPLLSSCAITNQDGSCRDYVPAMCSPEQLDCSYSEDGCKQCDCVHPVPVKLE